MMRINQFNQFSSNSVRTASAQQNSRTSQNGQINGGNSGMPDFNSALQRQNGNNNMMPQMPDVSNNLQPVMPGNVPSMPPSGMPENMPEMPAMPDGNSNMPPMMPGGPQGMQRPGAMSGGFSGGFNGGFNGSFSGMSGMSRFNAMSFMNNR